MSGLNPSGPAQPSLNQAYNTAGNPASKEPAEQAGSAANQAAFNASKPTDQRIPQEQSTSTTEATPPSMARGVRGAGPGEDPSTLSAQDKGQTADVDAEQMGAPGEGRVVDAVQKKSGAGGGEPGLETDLEKKKAQQAPLREQEKRQEQKEVDVGGVLGQRGGPASTVD